LHPQTSHCKTTNSSIPVSLKDVFKKDFIIQLQEFSEANFEFDGKIICFVGKNGIGKRMYLMLFIIYPTAKISIHWQSKTLNTVKSFVIDAEFIK
jgi:DNA replication and repair protein RecF